MDNKKLPLPDFLKTTKSDNYEPESKHYERGKWATFIYIPLSDKLKPLVYILENFTSNFKSIKLNMIPVHEFHISLTKTVTLRHHWIESFTKSIESQVKSYQKFNIVFDTWKVYVNEDGSKTFISLKTAENRYTLNLLSKLEESLAEFNLPFFFEDPSFHASIMWADGNQVDTLMKHKKQFDSLFEQISTLILSDNMTCNVNSISCKCGHKLYKFVF